MGFKRFSLLVAIRVMVIIAVISLLVGLMTTPGYHAASLLTAGIAFWLMWEIINFVNKTNAELSRFLDAARYADFSQRFELSHLGAGFGELGETFNDILERFREQRTGQEEQVRHLKALLEHVPVPLLSVHGDNRITLWNNAARRLFGATHVTKVSDLETFGAEFARLVSKAAPGERLLVSFEVETRSYQLTLAATQMIIAGEVELLVSLQDIQSELDSVQLKAWQDLVRVLTHEIMNSITPVASLAGTTVDLVDDAREKAKGQSELEEELSDVRDAVETVARRSESLMKFVSSYRRLTRLPAPKRERIKVQELLETATALMEGDAPDARIETIINPEALDIDADPSMIEQIIINIIQNAIQAARSADRVPQIRLEAQLNKRGQGVIDISDNGPGIPVDLREKIFVPFFTTKREGSGVGLALTRQVMIAHGGAVTIGEAAPFPGEEGDTPNRGARFTLTF